MATYNINTTPGTPQTVRVDQAALQPGVLPVMSIGEVLSITIRQNDGQGKGILALQGLPVPAQLPENLKSGDVITARIAAAGDQLVLRILDIQRIQHTSPLLGLERIEGQLRAALAQAEAPLVTKSASLTEIPEAARDILTGRTARELSTTVTESDQTLAQLKAITQGSVVNALRELAVEIRQISQQYNIPAAERFLYALAGELSDLLQSRIRNTDLAGRDLNRIVQAITVQLKNPVAKGQEALLGHILQDLEQARQAPQSLESMLTNILERLSQATRLQSAPDARLTQDLQLLANRFDQLANTQEFLNRINPLMQALGEPALVLFPYLLQGLFTHSEIYIAPRYQRKGRKKKDADDETHERYQRVQLSVPLPSLGTIDVDVAHRQDEIIVRLTVEDQEVGQFLLEKLESLGTILKEHGFEHAELTANVGSTNRNPPTWVEAIRTTKSVSA